MGIFLFLSEVLEEDLGLQHTTPEKFESKAISGGRKKWVAHLRG